MEIVNLSYELDMDSESVWLTATPSPAVRTSLPYVQEIGDFITHEKYYTRREKLSSYLVKYTLSGEGVLEYDGETARVLPGQVFWIDCKKPQFYYTSPQTKEWRVIWVHFYGTTCKAYYDLFVANNNGSNAVTMPPRNHIPTYIRELLTLYGEGKGNLHTDIRASSLISSIMSECCGAALEGHASLGLPDCVQAARTYLLGNYFERITLDDLAHRYSINKYYFQKLFKKYIGFTPNDFLILTRLNHAKEYLRTTNIPISIVAEKVGIENTSHFINQFKKHEGITPNTYRQRWYASTK
ncbi:AraC family transcriptional regulator [Christensenellaceae bacterium OttesenSCG-928-M15]|nr:AraC family transcriptional regulator [Christensenellaceae bacterium OttesenSCG-928-M15]